MPPNMVAFFREPHVSRFRLAQCDQRGVNQCYFMPTWESTSGTKSGWLVSLVLVTEMVTYPDDWTNHHVTFSGNNLKLVINTWGLILPCSCRYSYFKANLLDRSSPGCESPFGWITVLGYSKQKQPTDDKKHTVVLYYGWRNQNNREQNSTYKLFATLFTVNNFKNTFKHF